MLKTRERNNYRELMATEIKPGCSGKEIHKRSLGASVMFYFWTRVVDRSVYNDLLRYANSFHIVLSMLFQEEKKNLSKQLIKKATCKPNALKLILLW